jgi:BirA family biotin operon repressor/biotin-[acetyl-CoA-carboxylase] ligase
VISPLEEHHDEVESTNDLAMDRIRAGCVDGWTVVARRQTRGRGRHGRAWTDLGGAQLFLSVALVAPGVRTHLQRLPLAAGLAVADALHAEAQLTTTLKWPNDVLLHDRKVAGILCEAVFVGTELRGAVVGVGLNLSAPNAGWLSPLDTTATALDEHTTPPERARIATAVRHHLVQRAAMLRDGRAADVLDAWRARDAAKGRQVRLPDGRLARANGIADDGALIVDVDGAPSETIRSGEIRWA